MPNAHADGYDDPFFFSMSGEDYVDEYQTGMEMARRGLLKAETAMINMRNDGMSTTVIADFLGLDKKTIKARFEGIAKGREGRQACWRS